MAVSKRLRYEIFRRDNHTCRYCGGRSPDVALVVDHVVPVALGGTDEPSNLITACAACNSGKSASSPDAALVRDVDEVAVRWSQALAVAGQQMLKELSINATIHDEFDRVWRGFRIGPDGPEMPRPTGWRQSVDAILAAGLPLPVMLNAVRKAMAMSKVANDARFRYMCGICWRQVRELQQTARSIAEGESAQPASADSATMPVAMVRQLVSDLLSEFDEQDIAREIEESRQYDDGTDTDLDRQMYALGGLVAEATIRAASYSTAVARLLPVLPEAAASWVRKGLEEYERHYDDADWTDALRASTSVSCLAAYHYWNQRFRNLPSEMQRAYLERAVTETADDCPELMLLIRAVELARDDQEAYDATHPESSV